MRPPVRRGCVKYKTIIYGQPKSAYFLIIAIRLVYIIVARFEIPIDDEI